MLKGVASFGKELWWLDQSAVEGCRNEEGCALGFSDFLSLECCLMPAHIPCCVIIDLCVVSA